MGLVMDKKLFWPNEAEPRNPCQWNTSLQAYEKQPQPRAESLSIHFRALLEFVYLHALI
jgi:hypothetical protein